MEKYDDWDNRIANLKKQLNLDSERDYPLTSGLLRKDLSDFKIINKENYYRNKKTLEEKGVLKFTDDLDLDDENRLYDDKIFLQRRYIKHKEIVIRDTTYINITNCIIEGDLFISGTHKKILEIYIDNTVILGKLKILGKTNPYKIHIDTCNIIDLKIENSNYSELNISYSRIYNASIMYCEIEEYITRFNTFRYYSCINNKFRNVEFSHHQLTIKSLKKRKKKYSDNFQVFTKWNNFDVDKLYSSDEFSHLKTLEFIEENCRINSDRNFKAKLKKEISIHSQNNVVSKAFITFISGFTSASKILIIILFLYIGFSLVYMIPSFQFKMDNNIVNGLSFYDSMYFSGITLLTIGYGEITPVGVVRFLAILEGCFGIISLSSIIVALMRKYVD